MHDGIHVFVWVQKKNELPLFRSVFAIIFSSLKIVIFHDLVRL